MARLVSSLQLIFLTREMDYLQNTGLITTDQRASILREYSVKPGLSFIKVVVTIGAILVGLGVLSFIASNWDGMSKILKLAIIVVGFVAVNVIAYITADKYPKTGRSFIYLGGLVYGAGIFLIGQMFNFGGDFTTAFLLWSVGIVPMALQQRDRFYLLFANILFLVYIFGSIGMGFPWLALAAVPAMYWAANYFNQSRSLLFFANITALALIFTLTQKFNFWGLCTALIFFGLGLLMYFLKHSLHWDIFKLQGNILFGTAGVALTFPDLWMNLLSVHSHQVAASVLFAVLFVIL
ncbi:MAG TPA: DUF2157 domain-containing protein, partial [Verrucomicrobiae bacterium]|nr:DUF2157 domain-containing protein [Verrucomicrobiae bacterium]